MFTLKHILLFVFLFCSIFSLGVFIVMRYWPSLFGSTALWDGYRIEIKEVEGKKLKLIIAENPKQWSQGLMFVKEKSEDFDGMIFKFPSASRRMFWNMNTFVDLKLYWMRDGKIIGTSDLPSITKSKTVVTRSSPGPADTVIEAIQ